jgi:hypothetical protein
VAAIDPLENCIGFDWDNANSGKNWERHQVTPEEEREKRHYALGQTSAGRRLFVAFTLRDKLIPVISARDMNRNETGIYTRYEKESA